MDHFELETDVPDSDRNRGTSEDEKRSQRLKRVDSLHRKPSRAPRKDFSGFHKSTRMCLHAIREAVLHHRWKEATRYLEVYSQALEETSVEQPIACEIIWRLGIEILRHHPDSDMERFNDLYERMKSSGVKNYAKICLEYAFHLMLNGHIQKAKQQLTIAASWRYGKESARQALGLKLIHAYCGFLDYLIWSTKRASTLNAEEGEQHNEMQSYFRQALVTMQEIIKQPGVWDQFVCSCVDMLEYYNNKEEALQLLKHYAFNKDFPANPNAHVYLYNYQKKHNFSRDELLATLKGLHSLVPSHELMLKYCKLLRLSRWLNNVLNKVEWLNNVLNKVEWLNNILNKVGWLNNILNKVGWLNNILNKVAGLRNVLNMEADFTFIHPILASSYSSFFGSIASRALITGPMKKSIGLIRWHSEVRVCETELVVPRRKAESENAAEKNWMEMCE
ncbi:TATA box-binding protein-associated factor RNA polymerase I subunit A [Silurus asotus]|uniref:TATA box-binding protein-associated factor RNA polymerase I subunit A n=1 Tax=Silurus asotus TaxID=30991 RepID=A0AAD5FSY8_SILAS|nr:TATA box-binding protein-associated factor RNA polymerase I subunit A [Silurus asotus]